MVHLPWQSEASAVPPVPTFPVRQQNTIGDLRSLFTRHRAASSQVQLPQEAGDSTKAPPVTSAKIFELFNPKKPSPLAKLSGAVAITSAPFIGPVTGAVEGFFVGLGRTDRHVIDRLPLVGGIVDGAKQSMKMPKDIYDYGKRCWTYYEVTSSLKVREDSVVRLKEILSYIPLELWRVDPECSHIMVRVREDREVNINMLLDPWSKSKTLGAQTIAVKVRNMNSGEARFKIKIDDSRVPLYISKTGDAGTEGLQFIANLELLVSNLSERAPAYQTAAQQLR
jgi:hypothetical protein